MGSFLGKGAGPPLQAPLEKLVLRGTTVLRRQQEPPVATQYKPLRKHPELFDVETGWREEWFNQDFLTALRKNTADGWASIVTEHLPGAVFSCKMFSDHFCNLLIEEIPYRIYSSNREFRKHL